MRQGETRKILQTRIKDLWKRSSQRAMTNPRAQGLRPSRPSPQGNPPSSQSSIKWVIANANLLQQNNFNICRFSGHYACPNKTNIYHSCTQYCVSRWGRGHVTPNADYNRRRILMLKRFPLPVGWIEIYDPGS